MKPVVELHGTAKRHGARFVLGPLDLGLEADRILGIAGPAGSGKTTLLRLIWGFLRPDEGTVSVFGLTPHLDQIRLRARTGYVAQTPDFREPMSGIDYLDRAAAFYPGWDRSHALEIARSLGVDTDGQVARLTPTERAKLALAAALGHGPRLLLLDEPAGDADFGFDTEVAEHLRVNAERKGLCVVRATSRTEGLDTVAHDCIWLDAGAVHRRPTIHSRHNVAPNPGLGCIDRTDRARR